MSEYIKECAVSSNMSFIYIQDIYYGKIKHITCWYFADLELIIELFVKYKSKMKCVRLKITTLRLVV